MGPPGHFGIAFAAKPLAPAVPLWALFLASEALDLLSFGFISLGLWASGPAFIFSILLGIGFAEQRPGDLQGCTQKTGISR